MKPEVVAVVGALAMAGALAHTALATSEPAPHCGIDTIDAWYAAKRAIPQYLKSPDSASFGWKPGMDTSAYSTGDRDGSCHFKVVSHVDAQNDFGATIRNRFTIWLVYNKAGGEWSVDRAPEFYR